MGLKGKGLFGNCIIVYDAFKEFLSNRHHYGFAAAGMHGKLFKFLRNTGVVGVYVRQARLKRWTNLEF